MDKRYLNKEISHLWSIESRLQGWQATELARVKADKILGTISPEQEEVIRRSLESNEIDIKVYEANDERLRHDLNAFLAEREGHIPAELHEFFHREMTSYDTQEPAMAVRLQASAALVSRLVQELDIMLTGMAKKYRYTPMVGRSHGQGAELQTFGFRCLRYRQSLRLAKKQLDFAQEFLVLSKISGSIGNYTGPTMEEEREALALLGLEPFYGASQIMPRVIFLPLISALRAIGMVIGQIALDIRLGARSGCPIFQEYFSPEQMGSSAMPHKRNPISCEGLAGLLTLLFCALDALQDVSVTWEERAIEQSSTERVAWPDAFHAVTYSLKRIVTVLEKLRVYPENMLLEIKSMRGCYATSKVKTLLKRLGAPHGFNSDDAYRIVQLAAFNVTPLPDPDAPTAQSLDEAESRLSKVTLYPSLEVATRSLDIRQVIEGGALELSGVVKTDRETLRRWNRVLQTLFLSEENCEQLANAFKLKTHLAGEEKVFDLLLAP